MLLPSVMETIASIADRPHYSSEAVKLRLEGDVFFAFSSLRVIGGEPAEWDYVTLEPERERSLGVGFCRDISSARMRPVPIALLHRGSRPGHRSSA